MLDSTNANPRHKNRRNGPPKSQDQINEMFSSTPPTFDDEAQKNGFSMWH